MPLSVSRRAFACRRRTPSRTYSDGTGVKTRSARLRYALSANSPGNCPRFSIARATQRSLYESTAYSGMSSKVMLPRRPSAAVALPAPCWRRSTAILAGVEAQRFLQASKHNVSRRPLLRLRARRPLLQPVPFRGIQSREVRCLGLLFLDLPSLGIPVGRAAPAA